MPRPAVDQGRYVAVLTHSHGQNRSEPLSPAMVVKIAKAWSGQKGKGVLIETPDGADSWTLAEFALTMSP